MAGHIANASNLTWNTRPDHLKLVREVFGGSIELDPCWNADSLTDPDWACDLSQGHDGLIADWASVAKTAFVNPPFGTCFYNPQSGQALTPEEFNGSPRKGVPPYQGADRDKFLKNTIKDWIEKCEAEAKNGMEVIAVLPAAVDTKHWQKHIFRTAAAICFVKGRIRFYIEGKQGGPAPMACAYVYWGRNPAKFNQTFSKIGVVR